MIYDRLISRLETVNGENTTIHTMENMPSGEKISIVSYYGQTKDFKRLSFDKLYSPSWVNVSIENIKNNRRTEICFEVDKMQIDELIKNLQALSETISQHPDTKIVAPPVTM